MVGTEGSLPAIDAATVGIFQNNSTAGQDCNVTITAGTTGQARIYMGDSGNEDNLILEYDNNTEISRFEGAGEVLIKSNASTSATIDGATNVEVKHGGSLVARFTTAKVDLQTDTDVTGDLDVSGMVQGASLSTNGTETFDYNSGTFTMTMTGMSASVTGTAEWYRYGDFVHLHIPLLTGTANATGCTLTGSYPAEIKPTSGSNAILPYIALNGPRFGCQASIASGGTITIYYMDISVVQYSATLPSSDSRQIPRCMISYSLH